MLKFNFTFKDLYSLNYLFCVETNDFEVYPYDFPFKANSLSFYKEYNQANISDFCFCISE